MYKPRLALMELRAEMLVNSVVYLLIYYYFLLAVYFQCFLE